MLPGFPSRSIIYTLDALSPASLAWRLAVTLDLASFAFVTALLVYIHQTRRWTNHALAMYLRRFCSGLSMSSILLIQDV